jgi:HAD superfamily hydrolase (TIGR01549 family)
MIIVMVKGILLDIDGTLLFSNDLHAKAWVAAFKKYGYEVTFERIRPLIGMGGDKILPYLFKELSAEEEKGKQISEYRKELFKSKYSTNLKATPGARELVFFFKKNNIKVIIASSTTKDELSLLLKAAEVDDLITEYTTSDDVENSKPDRDIIKKSLKKLALQSNEAIMIGDTPYDIEAASKCNVRCIAVRTGGFSDQDLNKAFALFDDPLEIVKKHGDLILSL